LAARSISVQLPKFAFLQGELGVTGAFVGVPVKLTGKGAEAVYEFELSPSGESPPRLLFRADPSAQSSPEVR
jgi:malate/lactate dehydrogenase